MVILFTLGDLESGLALGKYPIGMNTTSNLANPINSSSHAVYSLSIDQRRMFFTTSATTYSFSSRSSISAYTVDGADAVFSSTKASASSMLSEKESKALVNYDDRLSANFHWWSGNCIGDE